MDESYDEDDMTPNKAGEQNEKSNEEVDDSTNSVDVSMGEKDVKESQPYQCHVCRKYFNHSLDFLTHLKTHANFLKADVFLLCFICGAKFGDDFELSTHLGTHQSDELPRCGVCSEPYNHITRKHTGPKPFKCGLCLKIFKKSVDFHFHINTHSGHVHFKCNICEKGFSRRDRLRFHKDVDHGIKSFKCDQCRKYIEGESAFNRHKRTHDQLVYVECDVCNKVFRDSKTLGKHRAFHNGYNRFTCKVCGDRFNNFYLVNDHIKTHFSEPSHACDICKRKFISTDELNIHRKTHLKTTSEESSSKENDAVISTTDNVQGTRRRSYFGPKLPFQCEQCPKSFYTRRSLHRHENSMHRDARHTCDLCGQEFSRPENLRSHMAHIHAAESSVHQCTVCRIRFENAVDLRNHNTLKHSVLSKTPMIEPSSGNDNLAKIPASTTKSFLSSGKCRRRIPKGLKNQKTRKLVHPSGATSVVSISAIYGSYNSKINTTDETAIGEKERGELDQKFVKDMASVCVCRFCGKCFSLHYYCCLHKKKHKESEIVGNCHKCLKAFGNHNQLKRHNCVGISRDAYECDICDDPFSCSSLLLRHRIIHKGPMHKCDKCKRLFTRKCNLDRHKANCHAWRSEFKCNLCHRYFFNKQAHDLHLQTHVKTCKCTVCNIECQSLGTLYKQTKPSHKVGKVFRCETCRDEFSSVQSYQAHQLTHTLHMCDICDKKFIDKKQCFLHRKTHCSTKMQDITCSWCGMKYTNVSALRRHRHRNMCWRGRSFPCILCDKEFQRLDLLQAHTKMHIKSSKLLPAQSDSCSNETFIHGLRIDDLSDGVSVVDQDDQAQVIKSGENVMDNQCNDELMADSEFMNEDDVLVDDHLLESEFPEQSKTSSVMYSCGECNNEFVFLEDLHRHIDTHRATSLTETVNLSRPHHLDSEILEINPESQECYKEHRTRETDYQLRPPEQNSNRCIDSVTHSNVSHNCNEEEPVSLVSKDIPKEVNQDSQQPNLCKCGICEETFQNIIELNDHISKHEDDKNSYKCDVCGNVLNSIHSFHNHCASHVDAHKEPGSKKGNTPTTQRLKMSFSKSSPEGESVQYPADGEITTVSNLSPKRKENNIKTPNVENISKPAKVERLGIFDLLKLDTVHADLKCSICDQTFHFKFDYKRHMKQHTCEKETQVSENTVNRTFKNGGVVTSMKLYKCGICDSSFGVPSELMDHSRVHVLTSRSIKHAENADSPVILTSLSKSGGDDHTQETALHVSTGKVSVAKTNTCGACARAFPSAEDLYLHCHSHVTSPTVKIRRWAIFDNIPGSFLLRDLPPDVYTPITITQKENNKGVSDERFTPDEDNINVHAAKDTSECHNNHVELTSKSQDAVPGFRAVKMNTDLNHIHVSSPILKPAVSEDVRMPTLQKNNGLNDASSESSNADGTFKSRLRQLLCSDMSRPAHWGKVIHEERQSKDPSEDKLPVQSQRFACTECNKFFQNANSLHVHKSMFHLQNGGVYHCKKCGMIFSSPSRLRLHKSVHADKNDQTTSYTRPFKCLICERVFGSFHGIRVHSSYHFGEFTNDLSTSHRYRCLLCNISFYTILQLRSHVNKAHRDICPEFKQMSQTSNVGDLSNKNIADAVLNPNNETFVREDENTHISENDKQLIPSNNDIYERVAGQDDEIVACPSPPDHTSVSNHSKSASEKHPKRPIFNDKSTPESSSAKVPNLASERHSKQLYNCLICVREFHSSRDLATHMEMHPEITTREVIPQTSRQADTKMVTQLLNPVQTNSKLSLGTGRLMYKCRLCPRRFQSTMKMLRHLATHSEKSEKQECGYSGDVLEGIRTNEEDMSLHKFKPTSHVCTLCNKEFQTTSSLVGHRKAHTGSSLPYRCVVCNKEFSAIEELSNHCLTHKEDVHDISDLGKDIVPAAITVNGNRTLGKECVRERLLNKVKSTASLAETSFYSGNGAKVDGVKTVDRRVKPADKRSVSNISLTYKTQTSVVEKHSTDEGNNESNSDRHNQRNETGSSEQTAVREYKCDICNESVTSLEEISEHCKSHTETENTNIKTRSDVDLFNSMRVSSDSTLYKCNICDREYASLYGIQRHYKIHESKLMYICHVCDKTFHRPATLQQHLLTHNQDGLIKCHVCGQKFNNMSMYNIHKKMHSHPAIEKCVRCCKQFAGHKAFLDHKSQCEKEGQCVCDICERGFSNTKLLITHRKIHEDTRPYRCNDCGNQYKQIQNLMRHMETAHNQDVSLDTIVKMTHSHTGTKFEEPEDEVKNNVATCSTGGTTVKMAHSHTNTKFEEPGDEVNNKVATCSTAGRSATLSGATEDELHSCLHCKKQCQSKESFEQHMAVHVREKNEQTCDVPRLDFSNSEQISCHKDTASNNICETESELDLAGMKSTVHGKSFHEEKHVETINPVKPTEGHQCCVCGIVYEEISELDRHLWNKHRERHFKCSICQGRFVSKSALKLHVVQKHDKSFKCPECSLAFSTPEKMQSHMAVVHPQQPYACTICNLQFQSMSEKQRHMNSTHAKNSNARVKSVQRAARQSSRTSRNNSMVKSKEVYHDNVRDDIPKRVWACKICRKTFQFIPDRQRHMAETHGAKCYKITCSTCGQKFSTKARLKHHETLHTGRKPFPCPICYNVFRTQNGLSVHLQYHTGERQYRCTVCDKKFVMKNHLKLHIRGAHPEIADDTSATDSE